MPWHWEPMKDVCSSMSSRASWAIRSMKLLAFKVRLQHGATKDTTRHIAQKRLFWRGTTKAAYLLRLNRVGRPSPGFPKMRNPSTCGFYSAKFGMVEGDRLNVVDRPISWRTNQAEAQNSPLPQKDCRQGSKNAPRAGGCSRGKEEGLICGGPRGPAWGFCRGLS